MNENVVFFSLELTNHVISTSDINKYIGSFAYLGLQTKQSLYHNILNKAKTGPLNGPIF